MSNNEIEITTVAPDLHLGVNGRGDLLVAIDDPIESQTVEVLVKKEKVQQLIDFLKIHYKEMMK